jgi:uncharacterized protein GlcG (DUF336 family)
MKLLVTGLRVVVALGVLASGLSADQGHGQGQGEGGEGFGSACQGLPSYTALQAALKSVAPAANNTVNGGLNFNMWATVVNRDGIVCAVVFTGADRGSQWPGSRVISAQKANTANAFSLPGFALSTANLYSATQPGGTLYGLQASNPVDTEVAYGGNSSNIGQPNDPMVGSKIGGVNVFGGGLALYNSKGVLVGALGVSGDTSCTDHIVAWKTRAALKLDDVPAGVADGGKDDNMINDLAPLAPGETTAPSASGFGHPTCDATATAINAGLPTKFPVGSHP